MTLYNVSDNSIGHEKWTWAWSLKPSLWHIGSLCDACNRGRLYPGRYPEFPLNAEVEDGSAYPDLLGCGEYPLFIVSETALLLFEQHSITGFRPFPLTVTQATGIKIKTVIPPQYYHLEISVGCELDFTAMSASVVKHCSKCWFTDTDWSTKTEPFYDFSFSMAVMESSLRGHDLFISEFYPCSVICTSRFKDIVESGRITNFEFTEIVSR